jgi:glycosyltransferase involved in cell wall biosynthesis
VHAAVIGSAMFGEDGYERELHAQAKRLGIAERVEFTGFRSDIDAELAELDILVHASVLADPLTTVVLEGMAAGMPVVSSDAGGHAEHVQDGVHGLKFPAGDAAGLSTALTRLAGDRILRQRLSREGAALAQRFSPEVIVKETLALYGRILGQGHKRR